MCSREQVFSHTCDGCGLQANPWDECGRGGACSVEVMFSEIDGELAWKVVTSEMSEEEECWKGFLCG